VERFAGAWGSDWRFTGALFETKNNYDGYQDALNQVRKMTKRTHCNPNRVKSIFLTRYGEKRGKKGMNESLPFAILIAIKLRKPNTAP